VADVLANLEARGFLLAVVSNWDSHLPALLEGLGLARRFRSVSVSAIEETGKPEPEIFLRTCARLAVVPEEALHVGDSLAEDYEGARAAGLQALLLDREDRHPHIEDRIRSLQELPLRF
jgi:HAD superfamily hydrolase (TIGR01549 family)